MRKYLKLSYKNIVYIVKDTTVICKLTIVPKTDRGAIESFEKTFVGKAKLIDGETFDFEIGKKISLTKAEIKAYAFYERVLRNVVKRFVKKIEDYNNTMFFYNKVIEHNTKYLDQSKYYENYENTKH